MRAKLMLLIKFFAKIIGVIGPFILDLLYPVISDRSLVKFRPVINFFTLSFYLVLLTLQKVNSIDKINRKYLKLGRILSYLHDRKIYYLTHECKS